MSNPQDYINGKVQAGNDVIFGEHHGAIGSTFSMMSDAIRANPNSISAVSLEFPVEIQDVLNKAQAGDIDRDQFVRETRITMEQSYADIAYDLLDKGLISEDQYSDYADFIAGKIEGVVAGGNDFYTAENLAVDEVALGNLYDLTQIAASANIPVLAHDLDREFVVLSDLDIATLDDWAKRLDDTSDFKLLGEQIDLNAQGALLIHRGAGHLQNQNGANVGLDDYLEQAGRQVTVLGNYGSIQTLTDSFNQFAELGITIEDANDYNILGDQGYHQSDIELYHRANSSVPGLGSP